MRKTSRRTEKNEDHLQKEIIEWILSIIIAVALALMIHNFVFQIVRVDGPSMEPTLYTDERMVVTRFTYHFNKPHRGDIVVTKFPDDNNNYVKRIIALEGETLLIEDGKLYINGKLLDEPYIKEKIYSDYDEIVLKEGEYMVMGDNRNNSRDSRYMNVGPLKETMIVGKVQYVVWPLPEIREVNHYTGHFILN